MKSEVKTVKSPFFNRDIARQLCQRYSDRELEDLYKIKATQTKNTKKQKSKKQKKNNTKKLLKYYINNN